MTSTSVLCAMLTVSGDARLFLRNEGVEETLLCAVANRTCPEAPGVLERIFVRAAQAASSARHDAINAVHVLHAMTLEPDSEGCATLHLLGLDIEHVRNMTLRLAGAGYASTASVRSGSRRNHDTLNGVGSGRATQPPAAPPQPDRRQIAFHPALAGLLEAKRGDSGDGWLDTCDEELETDHAFGGEDVYGESGFFDLVHAELPMPASLAASGGYASEQFLDDHLDTGRHELWSRPQTWGAGLYVPEHPGGERESGAFPVLGGAHLAHGDFSAEAWGAPLHGYAAEPGWALPPEPWPGSAPAPHLHPAPEPGTVARPRTALGVPRPQTPPATPPAERATPLGTPRLDLGPMKRRMAERKPAGAAPEPVKPSATPPAADKARKSPRPAAAPGAAAPDGKSRKTQPGSDTTRGSRKSRRKRTARESQEETARGLAARLFLGGEGKLPTEQPEPSAAPARERAERTSAPLAAVRHGGGPSSGATRSPIIRTPQRQPASGGFDRFELDPKAFPTLARYGRNLLAEARDGRLDPVIGRDLEIEQLVDIVNKRRSNNPLLVGPAGVGKTAIVEGLARLMACDDPPPGLDERTIIALDLGTLLCGTGLRGAFQERLIGIKREVKKARGHIVLFLDELHTWLGAGNGDAGSDASGELKIALARGELPCVGATTEDEFKRHIEADPAFERRFDVIEVRPPSVEDSIRIISGIIHRYADHHRVEYDAHAIESAVKLSQRYVRERTLPDKAIGILDRAGSVARRQDTREVTREHIAQVVSKQANVAVERLLMEDRERFLQMEHHLAHKLVGHEPIVERIARTIRRNYAGFASSRPIGSFLFLGPTGVGKTETVKVLADFLFGSRDALVRFDMSEFMEQHAVARLLGAPPGYVGFDAGGQLTEAVRRHPYQIVLLDEIEKAHPDVLNILLQLLDDGRLTDGRGRTVDFSNTVVIMTSNLGAAAVADAERGTIGFGAPASRGDTQRSRDRAEQGVVDAARRAFPPELWNRIEERLVFHALSRDEVARIAELQLADSAARLAHERDIALTFSPELVAHLIDNGGFDTRYGARPMRKTIQRLVEAPVAEAILRSVLVGGDRARVYLEDGLILVERLAMLDPRPAVH